VTRLSQFAGTRTVPLRRAAGWGGWGRRAWWTAPPCCQRRRDPAPSRATRPAAQLRAPPRPPPGRLPG
jgi:hypothetical protein